MNIKTQFGTSYIIFKSLVIAGAVFLTLVFSSTLSSYVNRADAEENSSAIEKVQDIAWNEHRTLLFVLNKNDTVSVYDAKADQFIVSQKPLNVLSMRVIEISQDGAFVAISAYPDGRDMLVSIFKLGDIINENTPTPTEEYAIASASTGFTSQQFSKDGRFFFTTRGVGAIYVLKTEEKDLRKITLGENDIPRDITEMNGGRIAVINEGSNDMVIVDFNAGKVLKRIKVGTMPRKVLYNAVTGRLFVSHLGSGDVYVIDGKTLARVAVLKLGNDPGSMTYDRESGDVFVANDTAGTLSVISPALAVKTVDLNSTAYTSSDYPITLFYLNSQKKLFLLNPTESKLIVYDAITGQIIKEIKTDPRPTKIAGSESLQKIFVSHSNASSIWIADGTTLEVSRAPKIVAEDKNFFSRPHSITVDAQENKIFVSNLAGNFITVIDGNTQKPITKITVHASPQIITFNSQNKKLYSVSPTDNTLAVIDTTSPGYPVKFVPTGRQPNSMTLSADLGRLYISNSGDASITVIDMAQDDAVVATIPFPQKNFPLVSAVLGNKLYVALYGSADVAVINVQTNKLEKMIAVGANPIWVRNIGPRIVALTESNRKLTFISTTTDAVTGSLTFEGVPYRLFSSADFRTDPDTFVGAAGYLYVVFRRTDEVATVKMNIGKDGADFPVVVDMAPVPFLGELDVKYNLIRKSPNNGFFYISHGLENKVYVVKITADNPSGMLNTFWYATINADGSVTSSAVAKEDIEKAEGAARKLTFSTMPWWGYVAITVFLAIGLYALIRKKKPM